MRRVWKCLIILRWPCAVDIAIKSNYSLSNTYFIQTPILDRTSSRRSATYHNHPATPSPTARHWLRGPVTRGRGGNSGKGRELEYSTVMLPESVALSMVTNKSDKETSLLGHTSTEHRARRKALLPFASYSQPRFPTAASKQTAFFSFFSFSFCFHKRMACSQQWVVNKCDIHQPHPFQYPFSAISSAVFIQLAVIDFKVVTSAFLCPT